MGRVIVTDTDADADGEERKQGQEAAQGVAQSRSVLEPAPPTGANVMFTSALPSDSEILVEEMREGEEEGEITQKSDGGLSAAGLFSRGHDYEKEKEREKEKEKEKKDKDKDREVSE